MYNSMYCAIVQSTKTYDWDEQFVKRETCNMCTFQMYYMNELTFNININRDAFF